MAAVTPLSNKRLLIVDDVAGARNTLKNIMVEAFGMHDIRIATHGEDAINAMFKESFDIVLCDYNMGEGKDGQQVLEEARFARLLKESAIFIIVTTENTQEMVMGALEYAPDGYITKPFTISSLKSRIERIVKLKLLIGEINNAIDRQDYDSAIRHCEAISETKPPLYMLCKRIQGRILLQHRRLDEAKQVFSEVIQKGPASWAEIGLGKCHFQQKSYKDAAKVFKAAIKQHPSCIEAYDWLSQCYEKLEKYDLAQEIIEEAIKHSPKSILRQMKLGELAYENNDIESSEKAFRKAVALGKNSCYKSASNYLNLAKTLQPKLQQSDADGQKASIEALRLVDNVKKSYKENPEVCCEAHLVDVETYVNLDRMSDAKDSMDAAEYMYNQLKHPNPKHTIALAEGYQNTNQPEKAALVLESIRDSTKLPRSAQNKLEDMQQNISEEAQKAFSESINNQAVELYENGNLKESLKLFMKGTRSKNASVSLLLNALQTFLVYMESHGESEPLVEEGKNILAKLEDKDPDNARYQKLSAKFQKYL